MEPDVLKVADQELKLLHKEGVKSYFSARRFYNPAIWVWLQAGRTALPSSYYFKLHTDYFFGLSLYAQGIITKDLKEIINGLQLLYKALNPFVLFKDFIFYSGAFHDTVFLANPGGRILASIKNSGLSKNFKSNGLTLFFPDETPFDFDSIKKFPLIDDDSIKLKIEPAQEENKKNIVGAVILPKNCFPQDTKPSIKTLYNGGDKRPKDELIEMFDGREEVKTKEIGSLCFTNPFSQILSCIIKSEFDAAFENALECLMNQEFHSKWCSVKMKNSKRLPDRECPYCKKIFTPKNNKQEFCQSQCRVYSYRGKKIANEVKWKQKV